MNDLPKMGVEGSGRSEGSSLWCGEAEEEEGMRFLGLGTDSTLEAF